MIGTSAKLRRAGRGADAPEQVVGLGAGGLGFEEAVVPAANEGVGLVGGERAQPEAFEAGVGERGAPPRTSPAERLVTRQRWRRTLGGVAHRAPRARGAEVPGHLVEAVEDQHRPAGAQRRRDPVVAARVAAEAVAQVVDEQRVAGAVVVFAAGEPAPELPEVDRQRHRPGRREAKGAGAGGARGVVGVRERVDERHHQRLYGGGLAGAEVALDQQPAAGGDGLLDVEGGQRGFDLARVGVVTERGESAPLPRRRRGRRACRTLRAENAPAQGRRRSLACRYSLMALIRANCMPRDSLWMRPGTRVHEPRGASTRSET
ncbi:MAG: hypothetical protein R3F65_17660 [bacterium]